MKRAALSLELFGDRLCLPEQTAGSSDKVRHQAVLRVLRRAIDGELTSRQRECLDLYYFKGLTQDQIAHELGVTAATVSRHMKRARQRLKRVVIYSFPYLSKSEPEEKN